MAEPKNPGQQKFRDWGMFQMSAGKGKHRKRIVWDGRPYPRISDLLMSHVQGSASEKLAWLQKEKAAGKLDGDDPDEVAEAETLLTMLARISERKSRDMQG
jgi:hypothetical protein